uniref:Uncharacterized protein n=1 Tax=Molossus molossus TaxID=27622 RepID=A0A7J8E2S3_MOLMO|nr:hypothetical protein HJG59_009044 [Molossus molossus]
MGTGSKRHKAYWSDPEQFEHQIVMGDGPLDSMRIRESRPTGKKQRGREAKREKRLFLTIKYQPINTEGMTDLQITTLQQVQQQFVSAEMGNSYTHSFKVSPPQILVSITKENRETSLHFKRNSAQCWIPADIPNNGTNLQPMPPK